MIETNEDDALTLVILAVVLIVLFAGCALWSAMMWAVEFPRKFWGWFRLRRMKHHSRDRPN